ncbi:hypothetical protein MSAN_02371500 [Mycena sanguinolenta]|uniref:Uncharacterized protein n=1 Tax=Mycena sanguinolenta TaxID=230812 RepID=A0A8H6X5W8_9AGAR|nr:hypothetical protein MSAN_02371500 [Mycena sanguinolenta]
METTRLVLVCLMSAWCEKHSEESIKPQKLVVAPPKSNDLTKPNVQFEEATVKQPNPHFKSGQPSLELHRSPSEPNLSEINIVSEYQIPELGPAFELKLPPASESVDRSGSPVPSSVDGEDLLAPHSLVEHSGPPLPSPLANLSPPYSVSPRHSPSHLLNSPVEDVLLRDIQIDRGNFPFSCRCGDVKPGRIFPANNMVERLIFLRSKGRRPRKTQQNPNLKEGMGALAKHGKFYYPVRLLFRNKKQNAWRVAFWRECEFPTTEGPPDPDHLVPTNDLVDSLYGNQIGRRAIRLGKWTHAHEIPAEDDILANFPNHPFTPELDNVLRPHLEILSSILVQPHERNSHIPAVAAILGKSKRKTVPQAGDLSLQEQAQILNWIFRNIPGASSNIVDWVGLPLNAHAITIVIATRHEQELRTHPKFPQDASQTKQLLALWDGAWQLQHLLVRVPVVDVDRECLGLFEQWMFECSDMAGDAGDEQWGLDAGHHQSRWKPYSNLPPEWSSYRSAPEDETKYQRGPNFVDDDAQADLDKPTPPVPEQLRPKPRPKSRAKGGKKKP